MSIKEKVCEKGTKEEGKESSINLKTPREIPKSSKVIFGPPKKISFVLFVKLFHKKDDIIIEKYGINVIFTRENFEKKIFYRDCTFD